MIDVHFRFTVDVPQLQALTEAILTLGAQLMEQIEEIKATLIRMQEGQAATATAIAEQVTIIATEVAQWNAESVTPAQLATLQASLLQAAETAEQQAAQIRANTQQISGIVPDQPPPA
jgi:hypothetical protein